MRCFYSRKKLELDANGIDFVCLNFSDEGWRMGRIGNRKCWIIEWVLENEDILRKN
jgi:hypothetical protein